MFENPDSTTLLYILIGCAVVMGALWYFVIAPIERRNHERKLELLQERMKKHEDAIQESGFSDAKDDR
jgi:hypothetical protein